MSLLQRLFSVVMPSVGKVIEEAVEDKDEANRLKQELERKLIESANFELGHASRALLAEIQGESWLQRNWRPLLMVTCIAIVANNYVFHPYLALFGVPTVVLELPDKLWNLMTLGVGGYVAGRSAEKVTKIWKQGEV